MRHPSGCCSETEARLPPISATGQEPGHGKFYAVPHQRATGKRCRGTSLPTRKGRDLALALRGVRDPSRRLDLSQSNTFRGDQNNDDVAVTVMIDS